MNRLLGHMGMAAALCFFTIAAQSQNSSSKRDPAISQLLQRAINAHGGAALTNFQTYREITDFSGSGPFGINKSNRRVEFLVDRASKSARWQLSIKNKIIAVVQQSPASSFYSDKTGTKKMTEAENILSVVPLYKTSVIGLVALENTDDNLILIQQGRIAGKSGPVLVRTQNTEQSTLVFNNKGDLGIGACKTTRSYLFAPDGTLIAEQMTQTQANRVTDMQLSYNRFQVFGGIKVPTEVGVKISGVPSFVKLKMRVKQVAVNAPVSAANFR